jgi:transposase-like protein
MNNPLGLSKSKLSEIYGDVKVLYHDNIEEVLGQYAVRVMKKKFERIMKAEVRGYLKAKWYGHRKKRVDYRNGYRYRDLMTAFGLLVDLKVPRTRKGYQTKVFRPYQRRWRQVNEWIKDIFIAGVSTRSVSHLMEKHYQVKLSAAEVSVLTKSVDSEVRAFHRRSLDDEYEYLFFDGVVHKVASCGRVVKKLVLVAYGIRVDGQRAVIDYWVAKSESEADWTRFLNNLYRRGLRGERLRMVVVDGGGGLNAALDMIYPHVPRQRCWVHKLKNVVVKVPVRYRQECMRGARKIYLAANKKAAIQCFKKWRQRWLAVIPKAVTCLEKDIEELLTFFNEDDQLWRKVRTTNMIERLFREIRKRTRTMYGFANIESCDRITYALFAKYNKQWKEHQYVKVKKSTHNY